MEITTIKGMVYDPVLDCGHVFVIDREVDTCDLLNDALKEFEGKMVEITIKEVK